MRTFASLRHIRLEAVHKAHTSTAMNGWSNTHSASSITEHTIILDHEEGSFALPPLPQDDIFLLQGVVDNVLRLLQGTSCFQDREAEAQASSEHGCRSDERVPVVPVEVLVAEACCRVVVPATVEFGIPETHSYIKSSDDNDVDTCSIVKNS